jgi:hypothetical protein
MSIDSSSLIVTNRLGKVIEHYYRGGQDISKEESPEFDNSKGGNDYVPKRPHQRKSSMSMPVSFCGPEHNANE